MKKICFLIIGLCLCFTSCQETAPIQDKDVVGLWRAYTDYNGERIPLTTWFRFHEDNTAERYIYDNTEKQYMYFQGTYHITDDRLTTVDSKERIYITAYQLLRCAAEFPEALPEWKDMNVQINSYAANELELSVDGARKWLVRVEALSAPWENECSEPQIAATLQSLAAQWDLRSYYSMDGNNYQTWYIKEPEKQGMTLTENGGFEDAPFWVNSIYNMELNAGRVTAEENIYVYHKDCAWAVKDDMLAMVCSSYEKIQYDSSGNESSRQTVTPLVPILVNFRIHMCSASWLTLYSPTDDYYFSFHRSSSSNTSRSSSKSGMRALIGTR